MSVTFTRSDVIAAKNNDLVAVTKIMGELLPLIENVAGGIARRIGRPSMAEDLAAEGRLKLWELISAHADDDNGPAPISGQLVRRVQSHMENRATEELSPGVNYRAVQRYMRCLQAANGDHDLAVKLVQKLPKGQRLSADLAHEVRIASQTRTGFETPNFQPSGVAVSWRETEWAGFLPSQKTDAVSGNAIRAAYVHTTLDQMSAKQARVLREYYMHEKPLELIAEETGATVKQAADTKTVARKNFHARFPFEAAYGTDKPALVAEHSNAKSARDSK